MISDIFNVPKPYFFLLCFLPSFLVFYYWKCQFYNSKIEPYLEVQFQNKNVYTDCICIGPSILLHGPIPIVLVALFQRMPQRQQSLSQRIIFHPLPSSL